MQTKGLTASQFAEAIGVQRATMSHIVNGRNNPSLEIVTKIMEYDPLIDPVWLIKGEGEMFLHQDEAVLNPQNTGQFPIDGTQNVENRRDLIVDGYPNYGKTPNNEQFMSISAVPKEISKIMIFYTDNTFDTFVSEKSKKDS